VRSFAAVSRTKRAIESLHSVAITFVIFVATGIRGAGVLEVRLNSTVIRPPDAAA
jgi:hypothetical protein